MFWKYRDGSRDSLRSILPAPCLPFFFFFLCLCIWRGWSSSLLLSLFPCSIGCGAHPSRKSFLKMIENENCTSAKGYSMTIIMNGLHHWLQIITFYLHPFSPDLLVIYRYVHGLHGPFYLSISFHSSCPPLK